MNIVEEWVDDAHKQFKDEEAWRIATVQTLAVAEKRIKYLNTEFIEANKERKSAKAALAVVEKQAEYQCQQLHKAEY